MCDMLSKVYSKQYQLIWFHCFFMKKLISNEQPTGSVSALFLAKGLSFVKGRTCLHFELYFINEMIMSVPASTSNYSPSVSPSPLFRKYRIMTEPKDQREV